MEIALAGLVGFVLGTIVATSFCVVASDGCDKDSEKAGVWSIKDRAYRLTKIEPEQT